MAEKIKFFYDSEWKTGTLSATSEHENFPVENTQHRDFNKHWRSQYGAGSGWGNFKIEASVNDRLDFKDNGNTTRAASLTVAEYDADELAAHIEVQMETVCSDTFTVEYLEVSNKFKITNGVGTFQLLWNTGTNKARSVAGTIGFDDSADDTGAANYTADSIRIHSEERISVDFGSAKDVYGVIIRGHNLSAQATAKAEFSTNNWSSVAESISFTVQDDIMVLEWDTAKNYRYVRVWMRDREKAIGYVAIGVVFVGGQFQPVENFLDEGEIERVDPSELHSTEHGQESSIQIEHFDIWPYTFRVKGTTEKGYFDALWNALGTSKPFFICEDPASPLTTTRYVSLTSYRWQPVRRSTNLWYLSLGIKEQR